MYEFLNYPGRIVAVRHILLSHVGIATGQGTVITAVPIPGVVELPWHEFSKGRTIHDCGYPSELPPLEVVGNARAQIGQPYRLLSNNCEHLVREAHQLKRESPQLQTWVAVGLLTVATILITRKARA